MMHISYSSSDKFKDLTNKSLIELNQISIIDEGSEVLAAKDGQRKGGDGLVA